MIFRELARQFEDVLTAIQLDPEVQALLIRARRESHADEAGFHKERVAQLEKERQTLEGRLEALYLDKPDSIITAEFYQQKSQEWNNALGGVKARLLDLSQQAATIYRQLEMAEKKRILNLVLSNSIWLNAQLIPKYSQPFDLLAVMKTKAPPKGSLARGNPGNQEEWYTRQESNL